MIFSFTRLLKSFHYAFKGLVKTFKEEQNLKIQILVGFFVILVGWGVGINRIEWLIVLITISLVILMEIVNSAIERVTDMLKPRINTYVKEIKDIMAAAVMMASIIAIIVGTIIFWPYILGD